MDDSEKRKWLKHLPEKFQSYVLADDLNLLIRLPAFKQWAKRLDAEQRRKSELLAKEYAAHFEATRPSLPAEAVKLHDHAMHDAIILSVDFPAAGTCVLNLNGRNGFYHTSDMRLVFTGVQETYFPADIHSAWWLYNELHLSDSGFELCVLLGSPSGEFRIIAENVMLELN